MKKILIYADKGADRYCISSLFAAFQQESLDQFYCIQTIDKTLFQNDLWQQNTALFVFPGGRDMPYHEALQGNGNQQIKQFVTQGGNCLGICAGGYYGSAQIEFEKTGPLEVLGTRELKFFPGVAKGPAYGKGKFCYKSLQGAQIAKLRLSESTTSSAYYNGGCLFVEAEKHLNVTVLARYEDIESYPAAIIKCKVGKGQAVLSGVHPEYSALYSDEHKLKLSKLFQPLLKIETERRALFKTILKQLEL